LFENCTTADASFDQETIVIESDSPSAPITYPLIIELFAFTIGACGELNSDHFYRKVNWTIRDRKSSCKNFGDDYNATSLAESE